MLSPVGYNNYEFDLICGEMEKQNIYFEKFDGDLHQRILKKKADKHLFTERELW